MGVGTFSWGRRAVAPLAGLGVYEQGPDGLPAAAASATTSSGAPNP